MPQKLDSVSIFHFTQNWKSSIRSFISYIIAVGMWDFTWENAEVLF